MGTEWPGVTLRARNEYFTLSVDKALRRSQITAIPQIFNCDSG